MHTPAPTPAGGRVPLEREVIDGCNWAQSPGKGDHISSFRVAAVLKGTEAGAQEVGGKLRSGAQEVRRNWGPGPCYVSLGHCAGGLVLAGPFNRSRGFAGHLKVGIQANWEVRTPTYLVRAGFHSLHLCSRLAGWYSEGSYQLWPALLPGLT